MDESPILAATGALLLLLCSVQACYGDVHFSTLKKTLVVSASTTERQVLKAGEDTITVSWGMNQSTAQVIDPSYHEIKLKLCYTPESQVDRGRRKTVDNLKRDKTCQFTIVQTVHVTTVAQNCTWIIGRDVPAAVYFVRAYAYDSVGNEIGYGQTTDANKKTNLFEIGSISGRQLLYASSLLSLYYLRLVFSSGKKDKGGKKREKVYREEDEEIMLKYKV